MWRILRWLLFGLLLIAIFDGNARVIQTAYACSGGEALNIQELTEASEIVVWGTVIKTDVAEQNGIFLAKEYWKGEGGETLTITQRTISEIFSLFDVGSTGDCFFFDTFFREGENRVMFLYRHFDGSYGTTTYDLEPAYVFPSADSTVEDWSFQDREFQTETLTLSEMRERVTTFASSESHVPDDTPHLPAPILIRTANDSAYMLPIDSETPVLLAEDVRHIFTGQELIAIAGENDFFIIPRFDGDPFLENQNGDRRPFEPIPDFSECDTESCFVFAPIYNYTVFTLDENTVRICLNVYFCQPSDFNTDVAGQAFSVSPTGEHVAIWNEDIISVYLIQKHHHDFIYTRPPYEALITIETNDSYEADTIGRAAWSSDSTWFAYSDSAGLWLADIVSPEQEPRLLIPSSNREIPLATQFSEHGRYLFIEQGETQFLYDLRTDTILEYTAVSPEDRLPVNLPDWGEYLKVDNHVKLFWIDTRRAYFMELNRDGNYSLTLGHAEEWLGEFRSYDYDLAEWDATWVQGFNFDYEPISGTVLVHNDATHISINERTLDLAPYLDSDIVSAEWLPVIFYQE